MYFVVFHKYVSEIKGSPSDLINKEIMFVALYLQHVQTDNSRYKISKGPVYSLNISEKNELQF